MKSLIISLLLIAVLGLGAGTTLASFRNTQSSAGNTFQAGNFDIYIDGRDNTGGHVGGPYFTVTNMKPGDTTTAHIEVKNVNSSMDALLRLYLSGVAQSPGTFADQLQATVTLNPSPYSAWGSGTRYGSTNTVVYSGPLTGIIGTNTPINNLDRAFNQGQPFHPDDMAIYKIEVTLPLSTGNAYQGATLTGTFVVNGTQFAEQSQSSVIW
ncbi:MAG: Camelysin metallo-endopeptidase [Dehalococcoidia bacterium]|nr:Camelysin metallo-endopeptidase [Dehalococcoidia bacterium]